VYACVPFPTPHVRHDFGTHDPRVHVPVGQFAPESPPLAQVGSGTAITPSALQRTLENHALSHCHVAIEAPHQTPGVLVTQFDATHSLQRRVIDPASGLDDCIHVTQHDGAEATGPTGGTVGPGGVTGPFVGPVQVALQ
jgi:hypothetical protein